MSHKKKIQELHDEQDAMWDKLSTPYMSPSQQTVIDMDINGMYPSSLDVMTRDRLEAFAAQVGVPKSMLGVHDEEK